jgi:hypothetical protein
MRKLFFVFPAFLFSCSNLKQTAEKRQSSLKLISLTLSVKQRFSTKWAVYGIDYDSKRFVLPDMMTDRCLTIHDFTLQNTNS